ncbi:hypothetical protein CFS9_21230 [Flavobacterium sp. CFS9]|uniref:HYR domain-containing protein n=1 Tax=Flavobacterium sp. CFS9 TaxID=3143118 RepID=A0AAT9H168_9FLAO
MQNKYFKIPAFFLKIALIVIPYLSYSQCTVNTINPSFEYPVGSGLQIVNQSMVPGWKTTAPDQMIEIWPREKWGFVPFEGNQFAELNAYVAAGLYQDFDTVEATTFNYSFAHRGRTGTDVMVLKAGPPGGPYTEVTRATTGNTAWKVYTGTYKIPVSQTSTRFIFEAISTANGDTSMGNFLDAINFTATVGMPTVSGAANAVCEGDTVTLTVTDARPGATVNWYDSEGSFINKGLSYTTSPLFNSIKFKIEQISASGCKSGLSDINVTVNPKPIITISETSKTCSTTTLTAASDVTVPSYVWYKNGSIIPGQTNVALVVTDGGDYKVKVVNGSTSCAQTSDTKTVVFVDTTSPVITRLANIYQAADTGKCDASVTIVNPTATDNCVGTITYNGVRSDALALKTAYPIGTTTITWTATDASGNVSASSKQTVTVTDNEKPVIKCPANITQTAETGRCDAEVIIADPTATDNCAANFIFTGVRSDGLALTASYPIGTTTISWTTKDTAGNVSTSCVQTITITDTEKPIIKCPANITQVADSGSCSASIAIVNPTATDHCSAAFTYTGVRSDALALKAAYPVGATTITWTATDASGNISEPCTQTITVTDIEKPVITCPANINQITDKGKCNANVTIVNPTVTDNCSTTFTYTGVRSDALALDAAYPIGTTTIIWTATDASGNISSSCTQTITIIDAEKPILTCPADINQTVDTGKISATVALVYPTATDNCSTTFTYTGVRSDALALTAAYPAGITRIVWTTTDAFGNISASCVQKIKITDPAKPVSICPEE